MSMRPERHQFKVGKYDILAQPAPGSAHMLRYTIMLNGKRLGSMLSMPSESNCRNLESPPVVPPLAFFVGALLSSVLYRISGIFEEPAPAWTTLPYALGIAAPLIWRKRHPSLAAIAVCPWPECDNGTAMKSRSGSCAR